MTQRERKNPAVGTGKKVKVLKGKTNGPSHSAPARIEQWAESSATGESRGAASGGFLSDADNPSSTLKATEEESFLRSEAEISLRNQQPTELVSGFDEPIVEAPASGSPFVHSFSYATQSVQEIDPSAPDPTSQWFPLTCSQQQWIRSDREHAGYLTAVARNHWCPAQIAALDAGELGRL